MIQKQEIKIKAFSDEKCKQLAVLEHKQITHLLKFTVCTDRDARYGFLFS